MMSLTILSGTLVLTLAAAAAVLLRMVQYRRAFSSAQPYRCSRKHRLQPHFEGRIDDWSKVR
jgi:hypothetical protein